MDTSISDALEPYTRLKCGGKLEDARRARNTMVLGVSVDSIDDHKKWKQDIAAYGNHNPSFPIMNDVDLVVSKAFDMLLVDAYLQDGRKPNDTATVRSVFIIGPDKQLKLSVT